MLATLGPVSFDIVPFNMTTWSAAEETSFVEKSVIGVRPPLEWVGEGPATWSLTVKLFPEKFGGVGALEAMQAARKSGLPQFFLLGDGTVLGWVVIEKLKIKHTYLSANGVGKVIECDVELKAASGPADSAFFSIISGIELGLSLGRALEFGGASLSATARAGVRP